MLKITYQIVIYPVKRFNLGNGTRSSLIRVIQKNLYRAIHLARNLNETKGKNVNIGGEGAFRGTS